MKWRKGIRMSERKRMVSGKMFTSVGDEELSQLSHLNRTKMQEFNRSNREEYYLRDKIMREVFGTVGDNSMVEQPVQIDYGAHIHIGDNFYANFDCIFMDAAEIRIGHDVMIGPRVSLLTASHPVGAKARRSGLEYALPITIEDDVWIGGNTTILPGVTIGKESIIGAGSIVTGDIPAGVMAAGNPCRVLRRLTEDDDIYWDEKVREYNEEKSSTN